VLSLRLPVTIEQLIELNRDYLCGSSPRIQIQMRISLGRGQLGLTQQPRDYRETEAEAYRNAGIAVA